MRVEHDYQRRGAAAYVAAWDVHRGCVSGAYASTDHVFWIVAPTAAMACVQLPRHRRRSSVLR